MMINIDILVSGCNTRCRHCYVAGGPGPLMPAEDVLACIEKLDKAAAFLPGEVSFTLDHEPMNHPEIVRIIRAAAGTKHMAYYHHGMTTGIALMNRKDRDEVFRSYLDCGYRNFGITLHGGAEHHDSIVRRRGAFDAAVSAARYFREQGAKTEVSLMLNRFFPGDAEEISAVLEELKPDWTGGAVPIFTPVGSMEEYETCRASMKEIDDLADVLVRWLKEGKDFPEKARKLTVSAAVARLREGPGLEALFETPQKELYLTVHADGVLYAGNSGAETRRICDLRRTDPEKTADAVRELPGNRDYGAFYDPAALPETGRLAEALDRLPQDLVYGDFESVLYRGLTALKVPTVILKT